MKEILFFDETENFIKTKEFASAVRFCDNYIVLVTREDIKCLSYSIKAVQQIVCTKSGKYYVNELKEYFKRNTLNKVLVNKWVDKTKRVALERKF